MKKLIVVVDMQNEFLNWQPDEVKNTLPTKVADYLREEVNEAEDDIMVIFTRDTHLKKDYHEYWESHTYDLHCEKDTHNWKLCNEIQICKNEIGAKVDTLVVDKNTFGEYDAIKKRLKLYNYTPDLVIVIGLTTNICVLANMVMLNTILPKTTIATIEKLTYGTSAEAKTKALDIMKGMGFSIV